jgi:molecular chaperone GrpE
MHYHEAICKVIDDKELSGTAGAEDPLPGDPLGAGTAGPDAGLPLEPAESAVRRLEDDLADARDRYLRLAAEFDNFRKRAARERDEIGARAQAAFAVRLLETLDDLDRLVAGRAQASASDPLHQAVVLIDKKLRKELESAGLERIDPVGQPFDPSLHEAVSVVPPGPGQADHTVSSTFQPGYRLKGSLIRPARVQVFSSEGHA